MSGYHIALIGGGFTVVGVLLGSLITYHFSLKLNKNLIKRQAAQNLIAAFSTELALIDPSNSLGESDVEAVLKNAFNKHYKAVLEYAQYLKGVERAEFMEAWRDYYQVGGSVRFFGYYMEENPYEKFQQKVNRILSYANT